MRPTVHEFPLVQIEVCNDWGFDRTLVAVPVPTTGVYSLCCWHLLTPATILDSNGPEGEPRFVCDSRLLKLAGYAGNRNPRSESKAHWQPGMRPFKGIKIDRGVRVGDVLMFIAGGRRWVQEECRYRLRWAEGVPRRTSCRWIGIVYNIDATSMRLAEYPHHDLGHHVSAGEEIAHREGRRRQPQLPGGVQCVMHTGCILTRPRVPAPMPTRPATRPAARGLEMPRSKGLSCNLHMPLPSLPCLVSHTSLRSVLDTDTCPFSSFGTCRLAMKWGFCRERV